MTIFLKYFIMPKQAKKYKINCIHKCLVRIQLRFFYHNNVDIRYP